MTESSPDDDVLVRRVLAGDRDAFETLVYGHQRALWKIAVSLLGDVTVAENFVQQCFVNAFERLHQYELGRDFGQWLRAIARNLAREELRRVVRENRRLWHYRHYLLSLYEGEDDGEHQEVEANRRRLEGAVRACRETLTPTAARALSLRYDEALGMEDIAAALQRTETATRQMIYRIRESLRRCVERRLATG